MGARPSTPLRLRTKKVLLFLDVACRTTSILLFSQISALESESSILRDELMDRELATDSSPLYSSHSDVLDKLSRSDKEKVKQLKKLHRDVAKLFDSYLSHQLNLSLVTNAIAELCEDTHDVASI
ncbi:hypothetical protein L2E82_25675 [Cichorium intybus]|uniref:Uncharacterized protein n=1 Tax=Cichorium intybus TaxID=13427 RepID=A0ACB9E4B5_CICIN|nr:hypothetical protein L2E82_25675 [Cichorium intybus]